MREFNNTERFTWQVFYRARGLAIEPEIDCASREDHRLCILELTMCADPINKLIFTRLIRLCKNIEIIVTAINKTKRSYTQLDFKKTNYSILTHCSKTRIKPTHEILSCFLLGPRQIYCILYLSNWHNVLRFHYFYEQIQRFCRLNLA